MRPFAFARKSRATAVAMFRRRKRAIMLILVLWITTVMAILAYSVIYQTTLETRLTSTRKQTLRAKALARAGIARGFVDLRNDLIFDYSVPNQPPYDALGDVWADPNDGKTEVQLERDGGTFTVTIRDEEAYFNINQFNASRRLLLEKIIQYIGYEEEDARIVASAIIDYSDADDQPVLDSAPGKEGFAYGMIRAENEGLSEREEDIEKINFPNEPFLTVEALMDVYGVTPELYFGPGTPEAIYFRERLGPQIGDRFIIDESKRRRRSSDTPVGLRDFFTVHGTGILNLNTAPVHVLACLIESAQGGIDGERIAEGIVKYRPGGDGSRRRSNDTAFKNLADAQQRSEIAGIIGPMQAFYGLNVQSTVFTLTSTGTVGQVQQTMQVTVSREMRQLKRDENFEQIERAKEREERYEDRRERAKDKNSELILHQPMVRIIQWNEP